MQQHSVEPRPSDSTQNKIRFETELEFVQCLANPYYLQSLAMQGTLEDPAFVNYLHYLNYFKDPKYSRFVQYPQCLHHLDLLTAPNDKGLGFRQALKLQPLLAQDLATKQLSHWAVWRESQGVNTTFLSTQSREVHENGVNDNKDGDGGHAMERS
ncbi:suppressor of hpr1 [Microbotryomycetes sp. JL221]|nr:suppressor of hpr1 [Microbotryomycetes sp. JL221]